MKKKLIFASVITTVLIIFSLGCVYYLNNQLDFDHTEKLEINRDGDSVNISLNKFCEVANNSMRIDLAMVEDKKCTRREQLER